LPEHYRAIGQHWKWINTASAVNNGSNDACGIQSLALSHHRIQLRECQCANTEILTVTDVNGNTSTCSNVTIEDNVAPIALCQNVTVQLDNTGNGSTTAAALSTTAAQTIVRLHRWP
jgi:hypothetical protein